MGVGQACGLVPIDYAMPQYSAQWHLHRRVQLLRDTMAASGCQPVPLSDRQPGQLLLFEFGRTWSHVGILVSCDPDYLVHAYLPHRGVVHQRLAGHLAARLRACYAYPEVPV